MITCTKMTNGNLLITACNETRHNIAQWQDSGRNYWQIWAELIECYSCNGSFAHFDAGQANPFVGLTSAPCIAESLDYSDDNGALAIDGDFWYFDTYMITDDLDRLKRTGRVIYTLAR